VLIKSEEYFMQVRTKAFLQTFAGLAAGAVTVMLLDYLSPKYGFIIFMSGVLLYLSYIMFEARVFMLKSQQDRIVDELKK
jgi:hypothetical protein